jgi:GGDEF domain-containing protein
MSALTLMSEATLVLDEHGAVLAANDLALEMFGYGGAAMSGQPPRVTVSAGVAVMDESSGSADERLVSADRAMYSVKRRGGDGFAFA